MKPSIAAVLLTLLGATTAIAQTTIWKADKTNSNVNFTVTHIMIAEVTGSFKDYEVTVTMNGEDFKTAGIEAVIKITSVNTDNENRDKDLRSDNFFNADSFPTMTFKSDNIEQTGADTYKVNGKLTIRNITKPVTLDTKFKGRQEVWGKTKLGFKATTTINRFDYNIKWDEKMDAGGLIVSNNVDISLQMELSKQNKDAAPKK